MTLGVIKTNLENPHYKYQILLNGESSKDLGEVYQVTYDFMDIHEGDELYILETESDEKNKKVDAIIEDFDAAKKKMEALSKAYLHKVCTRDEKEMIVNDIQIDHHSYSRKNIISFEKDIYVAKHHMKIGIHKVRVKER